MDYSLVTKGNPGIGGSEYEFLIVSTYLDQRDNNLDVYLFVNFKGKFPHKNIVQFALAVNQYKYRTGKLLQYL